MGSGEVLLKVRVTPEGLEVLDQVARKATTADQGFSKLQAGLITLNAVLDLAGKAWESVSSVIDSATGFVGSAIGAANESDLAQAKLNATLRASGQFSSDYSEDLKKLATEFESLSTVNDEAVLDAERLLVSFGAERDQVKGLTGAALDLSRGLGVDLQSAALLLGKAVAGEFATLSRYGILVDENASKSEKLASALDQITTRFGGSAQAEAETFAGRIMQLANAKENLLERIGQIITQSPLFTAAIEAGVHVIDSMTESVDRDAGELTALAEGALASVINGIESLLQSGQQLAAGLGLNTVAAGFDFLISQVNSFRTQMGIAASEGAQQLKVISTEWGFQVTSVAEQPLELAVDTSPVRAEMGKFADEMIRFMTQAGLKIGEAMARAIANKVTAGLADVWTNIRSVIGSIGDLATVVGAFVANPIQMPFNILASGSPELPFSEYFQRYAPAVMNDFLSTTSSSLSALNTGISDTAARASAVVSGFGPTGFARKYETIYEARAAGAPGSGYAFTPYGKGGFAAGSSFGTWAPGSSRPLSIGSVSRTSGKRGSLITI